MPDSSSTDRLSRPALESLQIERLQVLVHTLLPANRFYARKFAAAGVDSARVQTLRDVAGWPMTSKAELAVDQNGEPPYGTNLSYPLEKYTRIHQTSGTSGRPLYWLDTPESWQNCLSIWDNMFALAGIKPGDRLYFAFSFGPFLGFWTAFEAAERLGLFCQPGGGLSTVARLRQIIEHRATVVLCTPTYALHLAQTAAEQSIDLPSSTVRAVVVAGEPGGSIPATRRRIEQGFGARVYDHCGMTEVGPTAIECQERPECLHIIETAYLAEILDPVDQRPVAPGSVGELVLTTLVRTGSPLIRYRTGDLVRAATKPCPCGRAFLGLEGGILGRVDDMIHLRGNNVYPAALEAILRRCDGVVEYRITVDESTALTALRIEIEPAARADGERLAETVSHAIRDELLFRAEVRVVPQGSLPRFEMKARRVVRLP
jgi:phenylacetate-CoA ligase